MASDPYPYGEYIPTEGFDVDRIPVNIAKWETYVILVDTAGPSIGGWLCGNSHIDIQFAKKNSPIPLSDIPACYTHLYIVPPLTTK